MWKFTVILIGLVSAYDYTEHGDNWDGWCANGTE